MATKLIQENADATAGVVELRIAELERQLEAEKADLAALRLPPPEPVGENAVIRFAKYGGAYAFAAIKVPGATGQSWYWYITQDGSRTSRQGHAPKTWVALLDWIGERNWAAIEVLS